MAKKRKAGMMGRIDIETWTPDLDKLEERLAPKFGQLRKRQDKEGESWPKPT